MNNLQKQRGFTLIELVIYLVVASIAIVVVAHVWLNAAVTGADTRRRPEMSRDMQTMLFFVEEDLARMGAKTVPQSDWSEYDEHGVVWNRAQFRPDVYINTSELAGDSSSFVLTKGSDYDKLDFKAVVYDTVGAPIALDSVTYAVDGSKQLVRTLTRWKIDTVGTRQETTRDSAIVVAEDVAVFKITSGVYGGGVVGDTLLSPSEVQFVEGADATEHTIASYNVEAHNITFAFKPEIHNKYDIYSFRDSLSGLLHLRDSMVAGSSYRLELEMRATDSLAIFYNIPSRGSVEPADTVVLLLVNPTSGALLGGVDSLYLYPTVQDTGQKISFEISPSASASGSNIQLRARFAFTTSELFGGSAYDNRLELNRLLLYRLHSGKYRQVDSPTIDEKERSKSLDITMAVQRSDAKQKGGAPYLEQKFRKIVKIPNNGPAR